MQIQYRQKRRAIIHAAIPIEEIMRMRPMGAFYSLECILCIFMCYFTLAGNDYSFII